ncbi:MAG: LPS-assembly protein LptD [Pseudomonadales bacterium]|jgi:LPS-assembly protein|nr:LPS-assembly protein LptD [Pseudomonadales bacterium]
MSRFAHRSRRRVHAWRALLAGACLFGVGMGAQAASFSETQWRCRPNENGEWACGEVEAEAGPFPPVATAPIYKKPPARIEERRRGQIVPVGGQTVGQAELTWVPRQALPAETQETLAEWCDGAYQEFAWSEAALLSDPADAVIGMTADSASFVLGEDAVLEGAVLLEQGARRLFAEQANYDSRTRDLVLEGRVRMEEPGLLITGERASVDLEAGNAELSDARFVLYEGDYRGSADRFAREEGELRIQGAEFTRCAPGDNAWKMAAGRIVIPEDQSFGYARNARLEVKNVPIFWAPYLRFPVNDERQSGWLFPRVGFTGSNGLDAALPYYLNLAPDYDATITPRFMSERGLLLESELRHMSTRTRNVLGGAYIDKDDQYDGKLSFDEFENQIQAGLAPPAEFEAANRWLAQVGHRGDWFPGVTTEIDFAAVSDRDYFRDLGTDLGVTSRVQLDRTAQLAVRREGLDARLWVEDIQLLEDGLPEAYRRLPQLDMVWRERLGGTPLVVGYDLQYAMFDRDDAQVTGVDAITGSRAHFAPRVTLPLERGWGFFRAEAAYQYTRYDLDDVAPGADDRPERGLPTGIIDAGLRFERDTRFANTALLQTLEPRLYYLYIEDEAQDALPRFDTTELTFGHEQLFRANRFSGLDRIGDANQLTAALSSRLLSLSDGSELLSGTLGRIFYFDDREVTLDPTVTPSESDSASGWVTDLVMRLGSGFDLRALWVWDNPDSVRDQTVIQLGYRPDARRILNLAYRTRGDDIEQADLAFTWPVSSNLALIGRYFYDLEEQRTIETFGGFQYDDCCWRLRVVGRQFRRPFDVIDPNDTDTEAGVFFEILMKGLAGFDAGVNNILSNGIRGYRELESNGNGI